MKAQSDYQKTICRILKDEGEADMDARHVEAWMRQERVCLDGVSMVRFVSMALTAIQQVKAAGVDMSERLAVSEGL